MAKSKPNTPASAPSVGKDQTMRAGLNAAAQQYKQMVGKRRNGRT